MRIFFCGAPGVGKSTLVHKIAEQIPSLVVHDSMSALFMKSKEEQFESSTFQNKVNLYCLNIFLNSDKDLIMSRSIIDSLALNTDKISLEYIQSLVFDSIREDDFYFYLPIEFEVSEREDGLRSTDKDYQSEIDKKIFNIFCRFPSKSKYLISGSIESRVSKILEIVT